MLNTNERGKNSKQQDKNATGYYLSKTDASKRARPHEICSWLFRELIHLSQLYFKELTENWKVPDHYERPT